MGITLTPFKIGFTQAFLFVGEYLAVRVVTDSIALSFQSSVVVWIELHEVHHLYKLYLSHGRTKERSEMFYTLIGLLSN